MVLPATRHRDAHCKPLGHRARPSRPVTKGELLTSLRAGSNRGISGYDETEAVSRAPTMWKPSHRRSVGAEPDQLTINWSQATRGRQTSRTALLVDAEQRGAGRSSRLSTGPEQPDRREIRPPLAGPPRRGSPQKSAPLPGRSAPAAFPA